RLPGGCWRIVCGNRFSELESCGLVTTSARKATVPRIRNCSTGWRANCGMEEKSRVQSPQSKVRTDGLRTQHSRLRTQDSRLRTQDSRLRTQDSGLRTQDSGLWTVPVRGTS